MSILNNGSSSNQVSRKGQSSKPDNKPHKETSDAATGECKGGSGSGIPFNMIPQDDLDWAADQKPAVFRLFADCWRSDPYGTRWMPLTTKLKDKSLKQAKAALRQKGLFDFESKMRILENRRYYETFVINLHGSRRDSFWFPGGVVENPTKNQACHSRPPGGVIIYPTSDSGGVNNDPRWGRKEPQVGSSTTPGGVKNYPTNSLQTLIESDFQDASVSFQDLKSSISSSISPGGGSREEEFEISKKTEEEVTQDDAIRPEDTSKPEPVVKSEDTSKPETVVEPDGVSEPQTPASLEDKPELPVKPKDPDRDECSAAPRENENQSRSTEDAALLKWLVEVKLPSMELNEAPRNPEAYAKAMIRRDGDVLREEFAEVVRDRQFKEECAALTGRVEKRVEDWRQAGIELSVLYDFDGRPQVLLDGTTIAGEVFLNMAIESQPVVLPISTFVDPDHTQNRKARQSRLKCSKSSGECPGIEFLEECWQDMLLRSQVKSLIAKYPQWGIFVEGEQLQSWFDS